MKETRTGGACQPVSGLMTAGLMLALFIAALDSTVVATALPTISAALGGAEHYAWPLTAYLASSTVSTLLCGGLAFHFGLKRTYAFGLGVGVGMPVSNLSAQTGADARDAGRATSTAMFFRGFGGTVSTAVCGMLAPAASPVGTAWTFCAVLVSAVVGIAVSLPIARRISS